MKLPRSPFPVSRSLFRISLCIVHCALCCVSAFAAPPPKPEPAGMLSIETSPPHADVFVDRVNRAQAPAEISLRPGRHLVTLRCEGYKAEHRSVMIDDGGRTSLNVQLARITGILIAVSDPPGAEVTVDGVSYGTTPALVTALPLGTYKITFSMAGYKTKTVEVSVKDRTPVKTSVSLTSDTATLEVACDIPDVEISLNGVPRGTAPCTIDRIPAGEVELSASAKGYKPYIRKMRLSEGELQSVTVQLEVRPASLKVVSIPDKARVYIDNAFSGTTPLDIAEIDAGAHRVRVEMKGHDPNARNIELKPGEQTVEEFRLASNTGSILLTTDPDGVTVLVDGGEVGKTPPAVDQGQGISAPYAVDGLSAFHDDGRPEALGLADGDVRKGDDVPRFSVVFAGGQVGRVDHAAGRIDTAFGRRGGGELHGVADGGTAAEDPLGPFFIGVEHHGNLLCACGSEVYGVIGFPAVPYADDGGDDRAAGLFVGLHGERGGVRGEDQVRGGEQGTVLREGLRTEDVEACAGEPAALEGFEQGIFVHEFPAGGVDEEGAGLHERKRSLVEQVFILFFVRQMERQNVALFE